MFNLTLSLDQNGTVEGDTVMEQLSESNGEQGPTQNAMFSEESFKEFGRETDSGTETEHEALHPIEARLNIDLDIRYSAAFDETRGYASDPFLKPKLKYLLDDPNARLRTLTYDFRRAEAMYEPDDSSIIEIIEEFLFPIRRVSLKLLGDVTTFRCHVGGWDGHEEYFPMLCEYIPNVHVLDVMTRAPIHLFKSQTFLALGGMKNLERFSLSCPPLSSEDWNRSQIPLQVTQKLRRVQCKFEMIYNFLNSDDDNTPSRGDSWSTPNYLIFPNLEELVITGIYEFRKRIDMQQLKRHFDAILPIACKIRFDTRYSYPDSFNYSEMVDCKPNANGTESAFCRQVAAMEATLESYRRAARSTVEQVPPPVPPSVTLPGWTALGATTS